MAREGIKAKTPRVAVLMSTWNGEAWLRPQLDSLRAQKGVEVELFVRDDGSSDGTLSVLHEYAPVWPGLSQAHSEMNLRAAGSFVQLLLRAPDEFDYYAFCDQDDVWLEDKLARAVAMIEEAGEGPVLYCSQVACVDEALRPLGELPPNDDTRFEHILFENIAYGCTTVLNAEARRLVTERPPEGGVAMHDWWCALAAAAFGRVVYDPEPRILYRQHGRNEVGTQPNRLLEIWQRLKALRRDPHAVYPLHAQCAEFLRLYGDELSPERRGLVEAVVRSKRTVLSRLAYALTGPMVRKRLFTNIASRVLIVAGWY